MTPDLTVADVAAAMNCSERMVYKLAQSGALRGYKIGRSWRFPSAGVDRFRREAEHVPPLARAAPATKPPRRSSGSSLPGWGFYA